MAHGGWLLVGFVLAACHAAPSSGPAPATPANVAARPGQSTPQPAPTAGSDLYKPDAMKAAAVLTSFWALLGTGASAPETPDGWHRHAASGTCLPKGSASWSLRNERVYGPDDESVTLWNDHLGIEVSLFTYPARRAVASEFDDIMRQMEHTCTEGPVVSSRMGDTRVGACFRRLPAGTLLVEQAMVSQRDKWFNEVRITFAAPVGGGAYGSAMSVVSEAFAPCAP